MIPILILLLIILLLVYLYVQTRLPKIEPVVLHTNRLPAGQELRILQVSDLHNLSLSPSFFEKMSEARPHLIVVTGDLIHGDEENFDIPYRLMDELRGMSEHVYFVSGNNDWEHPQRREMLAGYAERGVTLLDNANASYRHGEALLNIVGVDDPHSRKDDLARAYAGVEDLSRFTLLLAHDPLILRKGAEIPAADLILSGHTHGGQVRLPFVGAVIAPKQGFFPQYDKGIFRLGERTTLYICSGLGTSMLPLRFLNRAQVSLVRVIGK